MNTDRSFTVCKLSCEAATSHYRLHAGVGFRLVMLDSRYPWRIHGDVYGAAPSDSRACFASGCWLSIRSTA